MTGRRLPLTLLAVVAMAAAWSGSAFALAPNEYGFPIAELPLVPHRALEPTPLQLETLDRLVASQPVEVQFSEKTGTPRLLAGRLTSVEDRSPEAVAQAVLERFSGLYDMREGEDTLAPVKTSTSQAYTHHVFEQRYSGIPVWRSRLMVHSDSAGVVRRINGDFYRDVSCPTKPDLSAEEAKHLALSFLMVSDDSNVSLSQRLVIAPSREYRLSYEIVISCQKPLGDWVFLIDALNGDIVYFKNAMVFGRVQGNVYDENPEKTPLAVLPIRDMRVWQAGQTYTTDAEGYCEVDGEVTATLRGPYCAAKNSDIDDASYKGDADFVWDYEPTDLHFDEVCAFHHVNKVHAWFKDYMGMDDMDFQVPVYVHYGDDMNNAFFSPYQNTIALGDGNLRDLAHEADVVMHEYGHAIVHNVVAPEFDTEAMDEGYADYIPCSLHDDPLLGEWWMPPYLRNLENDLTYPFDMVGEGHHDGQIWSGAIWDIRKMFGPEVADRLAIGALYYLTESPSFLEGREAILAADEEYFDSEHRNEIVEVFSRRGICELSIASWSLDEEQGNGNGDADPGETVQLNVMMRNITDSAIDESFLILSSDSEYVEVLDGLTTVPMIAANGKVEIAWPLRFKVSETCPIDEELELNLKVGYDIDEIVFVATINATLGSAPKVEMLEHSIFDYIGNHDELPNPGEIIAISPKVVNAGNATASSVSMRVFVNSPYVNARGGYMEYIYNDSVSFGDVGPGGTSEASGGQESIVQILESNTPDGYEYEIDYDILEASGRRWTGHFPVVVTGEDETPPWVAQAQAASTTNYTAMVPEGGTFYIYAFVVEPGDIASVSGEMHSREGTDYGGLYFYTYYYEGMYIAVGTMPADEDIFIDINVRDGKGNRGTKSNAGALGPPVFETNCNILYVADDFADANGMRAATMDALAAKGCSVDVWETEIRERPGKATLNRYMDGLVIFETNYDPYYMSHVPYLAYRPTAVSDFIDMGGKVLLMGQTFASYYKAYNEAGTLLEDYFNVELTGNKSEAETIAIVGEAGDVIGDGLSFSLFESDPYNHFVSPDILSPLSGCSPVFSFADEPAEKAGVRAEFGSARAVYFTFNPADIDGEEVRNEMLSKAIDWLRAPNTTASGVPIWAAGFSDSYLTSEGGLLKVQAHTNPEYDIETVELCFQGIPLFSLTGDQSNFYWMEAPIGPVLPANYNLELVATLTGGERILAWPYLPVGSVEDWGVNNCPLIEDTTTNDSPDGPHILVAGFCASDLPSEGDGLLHVVAQVDDPDGLDNIASVVMTLSYSGIPMSIELHDDGGHGDFGSGDGIFGAIQAMGGPLVPGLYYATIVAEDSDGNSGQWPSLVVDE